MSIVEAKPQEQTTTAPMTIDEEIESLTQECVNLGLTTRDEVAQYWDHGCEQQKKAALRFLRALRKDKLC